MSIFTSFYLYLTGKRAELQHLFLQGVLEVIEGPAMVFLQLWVTGFSLHGNKLNCREFWESTWIPPGALLILTSALPWGRGTSKTTISPQRSVSDAIVSNSNDKVSFFILCAISMRCCCPSAACKTPPLHNTAWMTSLQTMIHTYTDSHSASALIGQRELK